MAWKEALEIKDPKWLGIGKYLGEITRKALEKNGKNSSDLTNHLRSVGNQYIEPCYVDEYLSGNACFGCFFPQFRNELGINSFDIFKNVNLEEAQKHLESLDKYLTDVNNPESLVIFMKHKPGEELRKHVVELLKEKREKAMNKPYHSLELGLDAEEDTNRYMEDRRELLKFIKDSALAIKGHSNLLNAHNGEGIELAPTQQQSRSLYEGIVANMDEAHKKNPTAYYNSRIIPNSRIIIQPAFKRGRMGFTVDFLYPDGDYFDRMISECPEKHKFLEKQYVGLDAWKEAYTQGTFSTLSGRENIQKISNMIAAVHGGVNEFIPTREPTPAERYEIHQRWAWVGGAYIPGPHLKGPGEIERQMNNKPDPIGKSEFEETAYQINSGLTLMIGLFEMLPELVKDK